MKLLQISPIVFVVWGAALLWFSITTILTRARIELVGNIVAAEIVNPDPSRPGWRSKTVYTVQDGAGQPEVEYVAYGADPSLSRSLEVGSRVEKRRWSLDYSIDGETRRDFPTTIYWSLFLVAVVFIACGAWKAWARGVAWPEFSVAGNGMETDRWGMPTRQADWFLMLGTHWRILIPLTLLQLVGALVAWIVFREKPDQFSYVWMGGVCASPLGVVAGIAWQLADPQRRPSTNRALLAMLVGLGLAMPVLGLLFVFMAKAT